MITQSETRLDERLPEKLRIGLFIPCYIDLIYPEVGVATLQLLERFGLSVEYPLNQTCCGQPMSNSGDEKNAQPAEHLFVENFRSSIASSDLPEAASNRSAVTSIASNKRWP